MRQSGRSSDQRQRLEDAGPQTQPWQVTRTHTFIIYCLHGCPSGIPLAPRHLLFRKQTSPSQSGTPAVPPGVLSPLQPRRKNCESKQLGWDSSYSRISAEKAKSRWKLMKTNEVSCVVVGDDSELKNTINPVTQSQHCTSFDSLKSLTSLASCWTPVHLRLTLYDSYIKSVRIYLAYVSALKFITTSILYLLLLQFFWIIVLHYIVLY